MNGFTTQETLEPFFSQYPKRILKVVKVLFKRYNNCMFYMKVYEQSGYHCKSTPTIMLRGQWLRS